MALTECIYDIPFDIPFLSNSNTQFLQTTTTRPYHCHLGFSPMVQHPVHNSSFIFVVLYEFI